SIRSGHGLTGLTQKCKLKIKPNLFFDEWCTTGGPHNKRFLLFDNGLQHLSYSKIWYMNGNFGLVPKDFLQQYVVRRQLYLDLTSFHVDFKKSVIDAVKSVLGELVCINGCFYHLTQSTHRMIQ
ncbi:MULE domain-containing protein, partial [Aphis craccivora]